MYSFPYQGFNGPLIFVIIISVHGVMRNKRYIYVEVMKTHAGKKIFFCREDRHLPFLIVTTISGSAHARRRSLGKARSTWASFPLRSSPMKI